MAIINAQTGKALTLSWKSLQDFTAKGAVSENIRRLVKNPVFAVGIGLAATLASGKIRQTSPVLSYACYASLAFAVRKIVSTIFTPHHLMVLSHQELKDVQNIEIPSNDLKDLPDSFAAQISDHSKPSSYKDPKSVYIVTNENNRKEIRQCLRKHSPQQPGSVHIGVACLENYNFICSGQIEHAILFDYNSSTQECLNLAKKCILNSETPKAFVKSFNDNLTTNHKAFLFQYFYSINSGSDDSIVYAYDGDIFQEDLSSSTSWLGSQATFDKIKKMYQEGKIAHICADATDEEHFQKIADLLKDQGLFCHTCYISNVEEHILDEQSKVPKSFYASIKAITTSSSFIITSYHSGTSSKYSNFDQAVSKRDDFIEHRHVYL